ncbi:DUF6731 family protein [Bacillus mycoides]|uniref:Uncharacterized protein n=1 Tax=Bacillus mycoides (strain KBAB4) TaxID=315730 RepID=A9VS90_BACMK|nr:DUF6731 family protein [Bacillus mycoides]ABY44790.1 hypothetical protein BcerKBAB4_3619 [Bacillus mycoides KBAB4]
MKKFAYLYNCYITLNNERTNLELHNFLDKVIPLPPQQRLKKIKYGDYTSKAMMPDSDQAKNRNRKIGFAKYRDRKPYEAEKGTDLAELIKKDVLEMTAAVFIPDIRLVAVEYNHYGPRVEAIAQYLSSFLPKTENAMWGIELIPVETKLGWNDISKSNDIRQIEIKLDISGKSKHFISKNNESQSLFVKLIRQTVNSHAEFGANTAKLCFGNGRKKIGIQSEQVLSLLELLAIESELFETVKIKYKSPTTKRIEDVDLKNEGVQSILLQNVNKNSNWEYICDEISDEYYELSKPGSSNYSNHSPFKPVRLPDIIK